jgi:multidrug efflux system outer membrane protein
VGPGAPPDRIRPAQALASEEGRRTVEIGLVAGVASTYFNLRALDRQLEIARDTLASRSNALEP